MPGWDSDEADRVARQKIDEALGWYGYTPWSEEHDTVIIAAPHEGMYYSGSFGNLPYDAQQHAERELKLRNFRRWVLDTFEDMNRKIQDLAAVIHLAESRAVRAEAEAEKYKEIAVKYGGLLALTAIEEAEEGSVGVVDEAP